MKRSALIIGSNGYIGRHLAKMLAADGMRLRLCDVQPAAPDAEMQGHYQSVNLLDKRSLAALDLDVDVVFLFSGKTGALAGFKRYEEFITGNEVGMLNLLDHLTATGCRARVVFPSSRLVYKGVRGKRLKEDDEKECKTIYAVNKFACETYLEMYRRCFGIKYTVFRICVPYGHLLGDYSYGTMGFLLGRARRGEKLSLYGDGSQRRTFTHISDVCRVLGDASFLEGTLNAIFNIGGGDDLSMKELAGMVAGKYGVAVEFLEWPPLDLAVESGDTVFDSSKLDRLLGRRYEHRLRGWLEEFD